MKNIIYILLVSTVWSCKDNNIEIPKIKSSHQQKSLIGKGVLIGNTNRIRLDEKYKKNNTIVEIQPGDLVDSKYPLEYRIYHITSKKNSTLVTVQNHTHRIDEYSYQPSNLEIKSIYIHSSESGKNGLVVTLEDKLAIVDSSKLLLHVLEIHKSGEIEFEGIHESFEGTMKLREDKNKLSGNYKIVSNEIKIELSLKDGISESHYFGYMTIRTPDYCTLSYQISNQNFSNSEYNFDDPGNMKLVIESRISRVINSKYDLCDEEETKFNLELKRID